MTAVTRTRLAVAKVLYLLAVTAAVFAVPALGATRDARWVVVPGLLLLQLVLLCSCGVRVGLVVRPAWRLRWLFLVLLVCYAFLPADDRGNANNWRRLPIPLVGSTVGVNIGGLELAALMCLQILTVIFASNVVRLTGPGTDLVDGLRALRLPTLFVYTLDQTIGTIAGVHVPEAGPRRSNGDAAPRPSPSSLTMLRRLRRGDVGFFTETIRGSLDRARRRVREDTAGRLDERQAHDVAVLTGISVVMASLKMVKTLPGVPIVAGHKMLLFLPLYVLASRLTYTRWGGTAAGAVMGVVGLLQGDGRFGVLEILKHLAPGVVIDLLMPIVRRLPERAWVYCGLGLLAGAARCATDFAVVLLLGARAEIFLFPAARMLPTLLAGTLSGFVVMVVLRAFPADRLTAPVSASESALRLEFCTFHDGCGDNKAGLNRTFLVVWESVRNPNYCKARRPADGSAYSVVGAIGRELRAVLSR